MLQLFYRKKRTLSHNFRRSVKLKSLLLYFLLLSYSSSETEGCSWSPFSSRGDVHRGSFPRNFPNFLKQSQTIVYFPSRKVRIPACCVSYYSRSRNIFEFNNKDITAGEISTKLTGNTVIWSSSLTSCGTLIVGFEHICIHSQQVKTCSKLKIKTPV